MQMRSSYTTIVYSTHVGPTASALLCPAGDVGDRPASRRSGRCRFQAFGQHGCTDECPDKCGYFLQNAAALQNMIHAFKLPIRFAQVAEFGRLAGDSGGVGVMQVLADEFWERSAPRSATDRVPTHARTSEIS